MDFNPFGQSRKELHYAGRFSHPCNTLTVYIKYYHLFVAMGLVSENPFVGFSSWACLTDME
jgi:hypothetical protein